MKASVSGLLLLSMMVSPAAIAADENRASKIFTSDVAQKVLGTPVKPGSVNETADQVNGEIWVSRANYRPDGTDSKQTASILIRHAASKAEAENTFSSSKSTFNGVDVPGLGDRAYRTATPAQLNVLKDSDWIIITVGTFQSPDPSGQEKLAREILARMDSKPGSQTPPPAAAAKKGTKVGTTTIAPNSDDSPFVTTGTVKTTTTSVEQEPQKKPASEF